MSERIDQKQQTNPSNDNDPLAELARIVAGEDPVQVATENPVALAGQPTPNIDAETQVDFSVDIEQELMQEFEPSSFQELVSVPPTYAPVKTHIASEEDSELSDDFEASLENQLMQELDIGDVASANAPATPVSEFQTERVFEEPVIATPFVPVASIEPDIQAETLEASFQGLQEVETLAEEFASEAANEAAADYGDFDSQQEFAREVTPAGPVHGATVFEQNSFDGAAGYETGTAIADSISSDLGDDFDAEFEQIAKQASEEDYQQGLRIDVRGEADLEAEFESAFASELDQNDILPDTSSSFSTSAVTDHASAGQWNQSDTSDAQQEFAAAFPSIDGELPVSASPDHLNDPAMFDETALGDDLGAAIEPRRRSGFKMAALALGIALLIGFGAVGYGFLSNDGGDSAPIVVMADPGDVKVRPEDRGGVVIANQDKASYAELSGNKEEPEQDTLFSGTEVANEPPAVAALEPKAEERLSPGSIETTEAPAAIAPRKVRTFSVRPDGTIITPEPANETVEIASLDSSAQTRSLVPLQPVDAPLEVQPTINTLATDAPLIQPPKKVAIVKVEPPTPVAVAAPVIVDTQSVAAAAREASTEIVTIAPEPIDGATVASGNIAVPEQSPLPKPIKVAAQVAPKKVVQRTVASTSNAPVKLASTPAQAVPTSTASSPWAIQISSQRSREAADASYLNLKRRFPNLLNGRSVDIREAQVSGKGIFFRVRIQADSKSAAASFCNRFKSSGGSCFITR